MPSITIDGKTCEYDGNKTILQVALDNDIEIPHYCYHPGLSVVASCRICLAEVEAPNPRNDNKLELIPKLMPTCQTNAADGQVVHTKTPKSIANQKAVMEYLLINHPLDCPVCDQAGECHLQDYSYKYGRAESRFEETKIKQPTKDIGPHVKLYSDRCIMCSRCVRFTREVTGTGEIGVFGRGSSEQIDVFPGKALDNELSGNVVDICPVGALLDKDFMFERRVWELSETPSIDPLTCSGDNISIHHADGKVYRVKPRANLEVNQWWITDEVRFGWHFVHSEDRLSQPRRTQLGEKMDTDWRRAVQDVAENLRDAVVEHGKGSVAVMLSPMLSCEDAYWLGSAALAADSEAAFAIGPVPVEGEDKTFPGSSANAGFTAYAEKAPNARGVKRVIEMLGGGGQLMDFDGFVAALGDKKSPIQAAIITGNYPSDWVTDAFAKALGKRYTVLIDTLPTALTGKADVVLPSVTFAEKAGSFENVNGLIQAFAKAIPEVEGAKSEAQIGLDLRAALLDMNAERFDAEATRNTMGGVFAEVALPADTRTVEPDMEYVEL